MDSIASYAQVRNNRKRNKMKRRNFLLILAVLIIAPAAALLLYKGCSHDVQLGKNAVQATIYMRIPDAEAAIKADPDNALAHERLGNALEPYDAHRAINEYRTVLRLQPNNREVQYRLAHALKKLGQLDEAKSMYQQLAAQDDLWGRAAKRSLQKPTP